MQDRFAMNERQTQSGGRLALYPEIVPYRTGRLKVSALHELYYEECGNPDGKPAVLLHGGPGGGSTAVMRRYHELAAYLAAREPFDPIVFELEDEAGKSLAGKEAIAALTPWAAGLAHAFDIVPALSAAYDADADLAAALTGVLRHLPLDPDDASPEAADFLLERDRIDHDVPLRDLDDAIDELVAAVLDAVEITRPHRPLLRDAPKVGRNDPCPCGSGRKYKACHGRESGN